MKVSFNELQGLGRKAFAGIGFDDGDASDAADMVAWMEAHGLGGLAALEKGLSYLVDEDVSQPLLINYQDADVSVLDAQGMSILGKASLAIELGFAKARRRGLSLTKIQHCHNRLLIVGYLSRLARRGMNVTAFWRNAHNPVTEYVVSFRAGLAIPEFCAYGLREPDSESADRNDGISLVMANHVDLMPGLRSKDTLVDLMERDESALSVSRDQSLTEGIDISETLWRDLKTLADRLLVEATDASRDGAGAGSRDND